jgi:two-component system sensor histidine kinase CreC
MQRVVERLLELSALEAREGQVNFSTVNVRAVLEDAMVQATGVAAQRRVKLEFLSGPAVNIHGERFLLSQAVGNLLQNAVEFSAEGAAVNLDLRVRTTMVEVVVEDHGPGIPTFALEKVFDRFYSLPRPDSGRKSSGLGLSIVREIARLHGGEVTLENRVEGGARAILSLPRV